MVNCWSPDPPQNHCDAEVGPISSSSLVTMGGNSSDSENEEVSNNGYELLPMTPLEDGDMSSDSEEEVNNIVHETLSTDSDPEEDNSQQSELNQVDKNDRVSPSDTEGNSQQNQEMDPELMEQVKSAMSGFSLPLTAVPNWAFLVPEEEWRTHLVERMHCIQRGVKPSQSNNDSTTNDKPTNQNGN